MAYDEGLAQRLRELLEGEPVVEKKMFGGLAMLVDGNMCVGVIGDDLIARVGPDHVDDLTSRPGARPFDMTGKPMKGWLVIGADGTAEDDDLSAWVDAARAFVATLPPK